MNREPQHGYTGLPEQIPPTVPAPPPTPRYLRLFHPEGAPARVSIQEVKPGAKIEATDRTYFIDVHGSLRVVGKPTGNKKERNKARRLAEAARREEEAVAALERRAALLEVDMAAMADQSSGLAARAKGGA